MSSRSFKNDAYRLFYYIFTGFGVNNLEWSMCYKTTNPPKKVICHKKKRSSKTQQIIQSEISFWYTIP